MCVKTHKYHHTRMILYCSLPQAARLHKSPPIHADIQSEIDARSLIHTLIKYFLQRSSMQTMFLIVSSKCSQWTIACTHIHTHTHLQDVTLLETELITFTRSETVKCLSLHWRKSRRKNDRQWSGDETRMKTRRREEMKGWERTSTNGKREKIIKKDGVWRCRMKRVNEKNNL